MNHKKIPLVLYAAFGAVISAFSRAQTNKVVLICYYGHGYLCNPKYIAEAIQRLYPDQFDLVLLDKDGDCNLPSYIRRVPFFGFRALRELATARVWIDNCRGAKYVPKKRNQFYIQTWHGSLTPKKIERDAEFSLSSDYIRQAKLDGSITDLMFVNNDLFEGVFRESFWYKGPVIRCGIPRNRPLLHDDPSVEKRVRNFLGIDEEVGICLYAPTFRSDLSYQSYVFDYARCVAALQNRFGKPFVLVYRLHPNLRDLERPGCFDSCLDATDYQDAQELVACSDVLISDYSSILEDFALTGRPGFVFAPDEDDYTSDRGLYYPLEERPFPVARSIDELIHEIEHFDAARLASRRDAFLQSLGVDDDGLGDEVIARIVHGLTSPNATIASVLEKERIASSGLPDMPVQESA